jgi:hypothetical protein
MVTHHEVTQDAVETAVMRFVGVLAVVMPSLALLQVLANSREYRQPAVAVAVWLGVLGVGRWLVPRLRRGGLGAGETAAAIAVAVVAVAVVGATRRPHDHPGSVDLAVLGTIWLLTLIVLSCSTRVWIPAALLVFAMQGALLIHDGGVNQVSLSQLTVVGYIMATILLAFAALRPTIDMHARIAARRASLASRSAAERAAAAAIARERHDRLAILERDVLPLLRGIASGTLDPATGTVREQCGGHAAVLRDSLNRSPSAGAAGAGDLAAVLELALAAARGRGLPVTAQFIGDPGTPRPQVARAVLATLDAVLSALPPHQALLTVLAPGNNVALYLTYSAPPPAALEVTRFGQDLPAAVRWHAEVTLTEAGGGCLEIRWRKDSAT